MVEGFIWNYCFNQKMLKLMQTETDVETDPNRVDIKPNVAFIPSHRLQKQQHVTDTPL